MQVARAVALARLILPQDVSVQAPPNLNPRATRLLIDAGINDFGGISPVTPDYIICLEDGQKFKSLKRHLMSHYGLSPEEYREKWGLAPDYPMVAPAYAAQRSKLAREMGLGRKRGSKR